jgi:hypothetical protein
MDLMCYLEIIIIVLLVIECGLIWTTAVQTDETLQIIAHHIVELKKKIK